MPTEDTLDDKALPESAIETRMLPGVPDSPPAGPGAFGIRTK